MTTTKKNPVREAFEECTKSNEIEFLNNISKSRFSKWLAQFDGCELVEPEKLYISKTWRADLVEDGTLTVWAEGELKDCKGNPADYVEVEIKEVGE